MERFNPNLNIFNTNKNIPNVTTKTLRGDPNKRRLHMRISTVAIVAALAIAVSGPALAQKLRRAIRETPMAWLVERLNNASRKLLGWGSCTGKPAVRNMCANAWARGPAMPI
jgi:hypothetical protein